MTTAVGPELAWTVVHAAAQLLQSGLVAGTVGNVSVRTGDGMLITPSRRAYPQLRADDVIATSLLVPAPGASREWPLHAAIYRARDDVRAVIHTHSVHATAWSFLGERLEPALEDCEYYGIGPVDTAAPAPAASDALAVGAVRALGGSKATLLGRHGVVACGVSLTEALDIAHIVERQAQIAWLLRRHS